MFCSRCGAPNAEEHSFCAKCGYPLGGASTVRQPPQTVLRNRYRLDRLLGRGGMGEVWLAHDKTLDLPVAIKMVVDVLSRDPQSMVRLRDEARLAIQLHHPHIVRINHFEGDENPPFLVMEYVEGESAAARLAREGKLSEAEVRRIGLAVAKALMHAHDQHVLHRDIKPANILLGRDGSVKLADFGIARVTADSLLSLTGTQTAGTVLYMAPEVLDGEPATAASDAYALGVTLYELAAGEPPFPRGDLNRQIREKVPARVKDVSREFADLIAALLAKDRGTRPSAKVVEEFVSGANGQEKGRVDSRRGTRGRHLRRVTRMTVSMAAIGAAAVLVWLATRQNPGSGGSPPGSARPSVGIAKDPGDAAASAKSTPDKDTDSLAGIRWVRIPAGTFQMGCVPGDDQCDYNEKPRHWRVLSKASDLMATEVTIGMFKTYAATVGASVVPQPTWSTSSRLPVVNVTWIEAAAFCASVGGRLPTEGEWERAARGGQEGRKYPWGDQEPLGLSGAAAGARFNSQNPLDVAEFTPNAFGLYDMAGNVSEWTADGYTHYPGNARRIPRTPGGSRVVRGGAWLNDHPKYLRVSLRQSTEDSRRDSSLGFRRARDVSHQS